MTIMLVMTVFVIAYIINFQPFEDPLLNRLEVFNEITNLLGIDVFFVLCDVAKSGNASLDMQIDDFLASIYIGLIAFNVGVHLSYMARASIRDCKLAKTKKKWDLWHKDQSEQRQAQLNKFFEQHEAHKERETENGYFKRKARRMVFKLLKQGTTDYQEMKSVLAKQVDKKFENWKKEKLAAGVVSATPKEVE
jgi:hypothetical protein